jgi:hypothetical protein
MFVIHLCPPWCKIEIVTWTDKKTYWHKRQIRPQNNQKFLNIHHTYFIGQSMEIFAANLFPSWSMPSLYPSQLCFPARLSLLLCDFYLKIKKKQQTNKTKN